jgi:DNA-binding MarR family transcriptional regulator
MHLLATIEAVHRQVRTMARPVLAELGLTLSEYLAMEGLREGTLCQGELSHVIGIDQPTLSKMVKGLEARGYLTLDVDGRRLFSSLTPLGETVLMSASTSFASLEWPDMASHLTGYLDRLRNAA